jgi:hypothetical protein
VKLPSGTVFGALGVAGLSVLLSSVSPPGGGAACLDPGRPLTIDNPERDLNRVESIGSAIKEVTSHQICGALQNFDFDRLTGYFDADARVERMFPRKLEEVAQSAGGRGAAVRCARGNCYGPAGAFAEDLRRLTAGWIRVDRCYFKPYRITATQTEPRSAAVEFQFRLGGSDETGARTMEMADYAAEMVEGTNGGWKFRSLRFLKREQFQSPRAAFSDRTEAAKLPFEWQDAGYDPTNIAYGQVLFGGVAVGDFDRDGWPDLYISRAGKSLLLRNNRQDGFEDVTDAAGVGNIGNAQAALFADFDNDGYPDLFVVNAYYSLIEDPSSKRPNVLYRNNGNGTFTRVAGDFGPIGPASGVAAADFDGDGLLDLYVTYYQDENLFPYHHRIEAHDGFGNRLFRNLGGMRFEDVTKRSGTGGDRWSFAASWADFDGDGKIDLYVANDFGDSNLYRNRDDGTFEDVAAAAGAENPANGMAVSWGDYDNDGRPDIYVSNMYTHSGNMFLPLYQELGAEVKRKLDFSVHGNALYHNLGNGKFREVGRDLGAGQAGWAWGSNFLDYDNDGWQDIHVANGYWAGQVDDDA